MEIMFCRSERIGSRLIRLVTWSRWSHVALVRGDVAIEAVWPRVRLTSTKEILATHEEVSFVPLQGAPERLTAAWNVALSQVGKSYDLPWLAGFLFRRNWAETDKWACSELVAYSLQAAGAKFFRAGYLNRVTPEDLWNLDPALLTVGE